ncbi:MAG: 2-oxoacid:ferredoxin oxidoreductase subunit beta [Acidobacteria bacterium]|nr:2-oxoacid:ferredoxin oxidoreductase subunit beta [Acidobacteriota bacterium]
MNENGQAIEGANGHAAVKLTRKDFQTDQEVRWCPGCGDYSILAQVQKVMPELGIPKEKIVFISGIGCSSRFPYYMNTYGFHTIHGRAPACATGVKVANPDLQVWVITGDGDALSIGGNHFIHALRRNVDLKIILFNNRIYGLTKGQYSPTSELGKKNKSAPMGTIDYPINPLSMAFAAEATFVARSLDVDPKHLSTIVDRLAKHKGSGFLEVYQNCNIFNDGAFKLYSDREVKEDRMIPLEHGKPLVFGKNKDRGIRLNGVTPEVVTIGENGVTLDDILVHNEHAPEPNLSYILGRMQYPEFPVPMGVFRAVERPTYEEMLAGQISAAIQTKGAGDLEKLLNSGETWFIN